MLEQSNNSKPTKNIEIIKGDGPVSRPVLVPGTF